MSQLAASINARNSKQTAIYLPTLLHPPTSSLVVVQLEVHIPGPRHAVVDTHSVAAPTRYQSPALCYSSPHSSCTWRRCDLCLVVAHMVERVGSKPDCRSRH